MNSTEKAISSFFDFLNEHIRIEFKKTKNEYLLESYSFDEFGRKELPVDEDGYYLIFPKDSRDYEIFARLEIEGNAYNEYLNPIEQKIYRKRIDNDAIERYSLYNTLEVLYNKKRIEFYNNIIKRASEGFQSNELRQRYINDLIVGLEFNSKRVNNPFFSIKDGQGTDCLLLYVKLTELIQKIRKDYLENSTSDYQEKEVNNRLSQSKQPASKVVMEFIRLIDEENGNFLPKEKEFSNRKKKFEIIASKIQDKFGYQFSTGTLKNNVFKIEGFNLDVYNLLIEWKYNTIAVKYAARHNKSF